MRERELEAALDRELASRDWGELEEIEIDRVSAEAAETERPEAIARRVAETIAECARR